METVVASTIKINLNTPCSTYNEYRGCHTSGNLVRKSQERS